MDGHLTTPRGFTLVELAVVAAILGLVLALAVPAFERLQANTRVRQGVHKLMSDITLTRSEAIKRNRQVIMCPSAPVSAGSRPCAGVFASGWMIFEDSDRDRLYDTSEPVIKTFNGLDEGLTLTNRAATRDASELIAFLPDGSSRRNRTLMICSLARPDVPSWSVVMNIVGRPRVARAWGNCPTR